MQDVSGDPDIKGLGETFKEAGSPAGAGRGINRKCELLDDMVHPDPQSSEASGRRGDTEKMRL